MKNKIELGLVLGMFILLMVGITSASLSVSEKTKLGKKMTPVPVTSSSVSYLPDSSLTPGALNNSINQGNISQNICNKGWSTKSERPTSSYTTNLKKQQLASGYKGFTDMNTADYEEDHLISLELGGNPTDPKNLWPEPYAEPLGAKDKDKVENYLHAQVCNGSIMLQQAQQEISTNWVAVYQLMNGKLGGVVSSDDPDDQ